ncbi:MAG TPA: aspartyl protease family protein [Gemmataceae bacterium]
MGVPFTAACAEEKAGPVKVPFEMLQKGRLMSGHLAVQVKVNGKGPYRLIFDTGAPVILLSARVGKEAGLTGADRAAAKPAGFLMPGQVRIKKLEVGSMAAEDLNAVVFDHPTLKAIADVFGPIDGIVGFPFFARYRTAIDYQAKELTFTPNGYKPTDVMQALMASLAAQPRRGKDRAAPRVVAPAAQWGLRVEKADGDTEPGVTVAEVFAGSAAARAGVKAGDRLLTLDGRWTDTVTDCFAAAEDVKPGQPAEIRLLRNGAEVKLTVTPAAGL